MLQSSRVDKAFRVNGCCVDEKQVIPVSEVDEVESYSSET